MVHFLFFCQKDNEKTFYLCDFSRLLPPEQPPKSCKQAYLYQLFRKEFVIQYGKPLSCDAFSQFIKIHESRDVDNREVSEATSFLYNQAIPQAAREIENLLHLNADKTITSFRLSAALHGLGINVRHLFRVYENLQSKQAKALIMAEMVTRVIVQDIRDKLRRTTRSLSVSMVEAFYLKVLCGRMNIIFGNSQKSITYWNKCVRKRLWTKFCQHLGTKPSIEDLQRYPIFSKHVAFKIATMAYSFSGMPSLQVVFHRLQEILGFTMKASIEKQVANSVVFGKLCTKNTPFKSVDFEELGMRVKHMNIVSYAKGFLYLTQGLAARALDPKAAVRLLMLSVKHFEESLAANTSSKTTLRACAKALLYYDEEEQRMKSQKHNNKTRGESSDTSTSTETVAIAQADLYFRRAILADPSDAESLFCYAAFLDRIGKKDRAESYYREALRADPSHVEANKGYGDYLNEIGRSVEAEAHYLVARDVSRSSTLSRSGFLPNNVHL